MSTHAVAPSPEVTRLLLDWRGGDGAAGDRLVEVLYDELRNLARRYMRRERSDHTMQATELVHEAYARLVDADVTWQDRAHFMAMAARVMRRTLIDHARVRGRAKRGGGWVKVSLAGAQLVDEGLGDDLLALDEALTRLAEFDERKSRIIELRFFGGLSYEETAEAVGVSIVTVHRDLRFAKAWLYEQLH